MVNSTVTTPSQSHGGALYYVVEVPRDEYLKQCAAQAQAAASAGGYPNPAYAAQYAAHHQQFQNVQKTTILARLNRYFLGMGSCSQWQLSDCQMCCHKLAACSELHDFFFFCLTKLSFEPEMKLSTLISMHFRLIQLQSSQYPFSAAFNYTLLPYRNQ